MKGHGLLIDIWFLLKSPTAYENLSLMDFNESMIWIQIHNVPLKYQTCVMAKTLGGNVGIVEEVDNDGNDQWSGPFMRIRIRLDITKSLTRGIKLKTDDGRIVWCPILYEKLPDFCFTCGLIGHSHRDCQVKILESVKKTDAGYGDWMRATILKRIFTPRWRGGRNKEDSAGRFNRWGGLGRSGRSDVSWWRSSGGVERDNEGALETDCGENNQVGAESKNLVAEGKNMEEKYVGECSKQADTVWPVQKTDENSKTFVGTEMMDSDTRQKGLIKESNKQSLYLKLQQMGVLWSWKDNKILNSQGN